MTQDTHEGCNVQGIDQRRAANFFDPHTSLAQALLPAVFATDAAHDHSHILRVWQNVRRISAVEGGNLQQLTAATILHDCVDVPKNSPLRSQASAMAADKAEDLLAHLGWSRVDIHAVSHAILTHSFSAEQTPETLEARILQDADRLDAIGHVGIARCFAVSGQLGRSLYDPGDPDAQARALDDSRFAIDHFQTKLLSLAGSFQTETGLSLAAHRHKAMEDFLNGFLAEVSGN